MFLDFAIVSVLLVVSHLLRANIRLLQNLLVPASILAGLLGLLGGDQCLGVLPWSRTDAETLAVTSYPSQLIVILFATLFMGHRTKRPPVRKMLHEAGDTVFYNFAAQFGQFGFALLIGVAILLPIFPDLDPGFPVMLAAGFVGGHGTATVFGEALEREGWADAMSIGYTFATIGLLAGIFGGLLLINIATRRRWARLVRSAHELPDSIKRGFLPDGDQPSLGRSTVSSMALDPLAWHVALVFSVFGAAHLVDYASKQWVSEHQTLPLFAVAMLLGAATQYILELLGIGKFVDRAVMTRIGSSASDYLIVCGIATIRLDVVWNHAVPLAVMSVCGVAYGAGMLWCLGRRVFHNYWFERSIFVYGYSTGIVAVGIMLLRVVDPKLRSQTLEDYGLAYLAISPCDIVLLVVLPWLVAMRIIVIPGMVLIAIFVVCMLASAYLIGWNSQPPDAARPGERSE